MKDTKNSSTFWSYFSLLFLSFYFLFLFLAETRSLLWFITPLTVLYLGTIFYKLWKNSKEISSQQHTIVTVVLASVVLLLALTHWSSSVPLSLSRWVTVALAALTFCIFFVTPKLTESVQKSIFLSTTFLHGIFVPIGVFFLFFQDISINWLPIGSLLTFLHGQNHAYILYLYSLPITTFYWIKSNYRFQWLLLNFLFIIGIITSFSRFGLALLLLEFVVLLIWFSREKGIHKSIPKIIWGVFVGVLFYSGALFIFSIIPQLSFGNNCQAPVLQRQLCKGFIADSRLAYWSQAVKSFVQHPLTGSGGGTFSLVSTRYNLKPNHYSGEAHNEYLGLISDYGVFGVAIVGAYVWFLIWALKKWSQATAFTKVLLISLGIGSLDALTNFNWKYEGILIYHSLLIAVITRNLLQEKRKNPPKKKNNTIWIVLIFVLSSLIGATLIWFSTFYVMAELLYKSKSEKYVEIFPYEQSQASAAYLSPLTTDSTKEKIRELYRNHSLIFQIIVNQKNDPAEQLNLYAQYLQLDPLHLENRVKLISLAVSQDQPQIVKENLEWLGNYYPDYEKHQIRDLDYVYLEKIITYANQLSERDPQQARELTIAAYRFEPWRVNEVKSVFLSQPEKFTATDVVEIIQVLPQDLWMYNEPLSHWTVHQATQAAEQENWQQLTMYSELTLRLADWKMWELWAEIFPVFEQKINSLDLSQPEDVDRKKLLLEKWRGALASIKKFDTVGFATSEWSKQISNFE